MKFFILFVFCSMSFQKITSHTNHCSQESIITACENQSLPLRVILVNKLNTQSALDGITSVATVQQEPHKTLQHNLSKLYLVHILIIDFELDTVFNSQSE